MNHLQELVKIEAMAIRRQNEEEERPVAIDTLHRTLNSVKEFIDQQKTIESSQRPQTDEELADLLKKSQDIFKWLQEKSKKQAGTAKNVDPVLPVADLNSKNSELNDQLTFLQSKKMPVKIEVEEDKPVAEEEKPVEDQVEEQTNKPQESENENVSAENQASSPAEAANPAESTKTGEISKEDLVEERFEL